MPGSLVRGADPLVAPSLDHGQVHNWQHATANIPDIQVKFEAILAHVKFVHFGGPHHTSRVVGVDNGEAPRTEVAINRSAQ